MSQTEDQVLQADFEIVAKEPIEATFTISPNITDLNFEFTQEEPASTWVIEHNLGKYPSVTIVNPSGEMVQTDYTYINENTIEVYFASAFAGKAYLN